MVAPATSLGHPIVGAMKLGSPILGRVKCANFFAASWSYLFSATAMRTRANTVALAERWLKLPKQCCRTKFSSLRFAGNRLSTKRFAVLFALLPMKPLCAQTAPVTPDRPWHGAQEVSLTRELRQYTQTGLAPDASKTYDLVELVDFAEQHNPQTRVAWQNAKAQAAVLGIARSELYPALAAVALAGVDRTEVLLGTRFFRQTVGDFQAALDLNYTIFDFGARRGRINAAEAAGP